MARLVTNQNPSGRGPLRAAIVGFATVAAIGLTGLVGSQPAGAAGQDTINQVTTISYAPNSYVIGNAYPNWTDYVQGGGQGGGNALNYRWGFLVGENFSYCAWITDGTQNAGPAAGDQCGSPQQQDTAYFTATFTNGTVSPGVSDGNPTARTGAGDCGTGYGNVEPWRATSTPGNPRSVDAGDTLLWRYVTKDGAFVLVHDKTSDATGATPNWFFIPSDCLVLQ